jgi:dienelactone hydrolase
VHALLAKPLDWYTIRLACRCTRSKAKTDRPGKLSSKTIGTATELWGGPASLPREWTLGENGTFSYASPVRSASNINNRVFGRFFPAEKKWMSKPTVLLLHGWNAELCYRHLFPWLATRLQRQGWNTAMIELPYHMQRRPRSGPVTDFISTDLEGMLGATRQAVADIRAVGQWLQSQGSPSVGLWGFSLGAWLAGLTACVDDTLGFAVLTTPMARIDRGVAELPFCEPVRRSLQAHRVDLSGLNLASHRPRIDRQRLLLVESRHDLFVPPETVEELWRTWNRPEIWRVGHGHISVLVSFSVMERTIQWIARQQPCKKA